MYFESFFDENLAQKSYLIGCQRTGEALVIDPARDLSAYFETAEKEGFTLSAAAETHIHADFVSGAKEMAKQAEATLYLSNEGEADWKYQYVEYIAHQLLNDGDVFYVGNIKLEVMHTPGHTPESLSFILTDEGGGADTPMGVFTGDFVFVGDVGRPDLLEKAAGETGSSESSAATMYDSIQRFKSLPDYVQIWPGHGAGSACGKSLGSVPLSTVGYEKRTNWAFQIEDRATFVQQLLEGQPEPPKYFAMMKKLNKEGPAYVNQQSVSMMDLDQLDTEKQFVVDTRPSSAFAEGHLPGTINIPFNASFANWAGWLLPYNQEISLIGDPSHREDIQKVLQSIGLDHLKGMVDAQELENMSKLETYEEISAAQLKEYFRHEEEFLIVDVRYQSEWDAGHIENALHVMLGDLPERINEIPADKTPIVHCRSGARAAIAVSILQANGFKQTKNLKGGYLAWTKAKYPVTS
ncbi:MBL fold metallo-hydrolase [Thalassobacillus sp. CUG 92003]|uniref:MBL fold metallo-hydrolase n=1 Tax=Thalassobacillus sp. CUG 92003 TaxID=2736641 RepID=UPI0015E78611|nr:MBL fold metallo-hydrolase [Thalassobacillus sp. CUG 92003]